MNTTELREALDVLAGPAPPPTDAARAAVAGRVRSSRRRAGIAGGAIAICISLAVVAGGLAVSGRDSSSQVVTGSRTGACRRLPRAVPRAGVPAPVRQWAGGARVVGHGSLWTVRRTLEQRGTNDPPVVRLKLGWFVLPADPTAAPPVLTAREIGGPGRATGDANAATDQRGTWFASTIELPASSECWEISARHAGDVIRFRYPVPPRR